MTPDHGSNHHGDDNDGGCLDGNGGGDGGTIGTGDADGYGLSGGVFNDDGGAGSSGSNNSSNGGGGGGGDRGGSERGGSEREEYRGAATLLLEDGPVPVEVRMSVRFEPVEGRFRWAGRTGPHDLLRERVGAGLRAATIVVAGSPGTAITLSDPDPWGGVRISGTGTPPWFTPGDS